LKKARARLTVLQIKRLIDTGELRISIPPGCDELSLSIDSKDEMLLKVAKNVQDAIDLGAKVK
jgi:hypothetical protein